MALTFPELKEQLKDMEETLFLEMFNISTDELVERFEDKIEEKFNELMEEYGNDFTE